MFTATQIGYLSTSIDTYVAVLKRKINAESNSEIKSLLQRSLFEVEELRPLIHNPKLIKG